MARRPQIEAFAREHGLKIGTIADMIRYRLRNERSIERVSDQVVHTEFGDLHLYAYRDLVHQGMHFALAHGNLDGSVAPLVRVHVTDTLRDLLGIRTDARAWTLRAALERIAHAASGALIVLKEEAATANNEDGAVLRTYGVGAQILKDLGVRRMRVLSAPKQMAGISAFDLEIDSYVGENS